MENSEGKWISIDNYAARRGISKSTVYRRIRKGELTKRNDDEGTEVFLRGDELDAYEDSPEISGITSASAPLDLDIDSEDAYSIAEQSLRALISMHKEVLAEKSRMLKELEQELRDREERLRELTGSLSANEAMLGERTSETRDLKRTLRHRDEIIKEHERALNEYRRQEEQREEFEHFADSSREELTAALDEKNKLLEEKDRLIEDVRHTVSQREEVYSESGRLVEDLKSSLAEARDLIKQKDEMIEALKTGDTSAMESDIKSRDETISELRHMVQTLESQLDMRAHSSELTGFSEEAAPETGTLIQDQLEYLMSSEDTEQYLNGSIPPEENNNEE